MMLEKIDRISIFGVLSKYILIDKEYLFMKKAVMITALVAVATMSLFAFGIGVQGGTNLNGGGGNTSLTFKVDNLPYVFAADLVFSDSYTSFGLTADRWISTKKLGGPVSFFYGFGGAGWLSSTSSYTNLGIAARIVAGLNAMVLDNFVELYIQLAWQPGIKIIQDFQLIPWSFPLAFGVRFWFK